MNYLIKSIGHYDRKYRHLNVNGLYHKLDEVKVLLEETKFDILALTEIISKMQQLTQKLLLKVTRCFEKIEQEKRNGEEH